MLPLIRIHLRAFLVYSNGKRGLILFSKKVDNAPNVAKSVDFLGILCTYQTQRKKKSEFSVLKTLTISQIPFHLC